MPEPTYSFTIPSIHGDTPLECRVYHPKRLATILRAAQSPLRGAIVAHPYAPFGGCFDDAVVLSVAETLLDEGVVVGTFNFRGAGDSAGSTSLSGKAEQADYESMVGFFINYLQRLRPVDEHETIPPSSAEDDVLAGEADAPVIVEVGEHNKIEMLLAGYSYGSLILARLPSVQEILQRFDAEGERHAVKEILSTAGRLATETTHTLQTMQGAQRQSVDSQGKTRRSDKSTTTFGGDDNSPSGGKKNRHLRRSTDLAHEGVEKLRMKRWSHPRRSHDEKEPIKQAPPTTSLEKHTLPAISVRYLLISPVILPFMLSICPPGLVSSLPSIPVLKKDHDSGHKSEYLQHPSLAVFGNKDTFTSSHRLRGWADKQSKESHSTFEWEEIAGAGHFWREQGAMQGLQSKIVSWMKKTGL